jgi:hypothetical protein
MSKCRSCGAEIEWAEWEDSRKAVPLDVGTSPNGNLAVANGKVHRYAEQDRRLARDRRVSHFSTCPDAADWRGRAR